MASKVIGTEYNPSTGVLVVTVRHTDADSFTRSVDRAARKAWRKHYACGEATSYEGGNYACETEGRECVSMVGYGPSFDAVYRAIGRGDLAEGGRP